MDRLADLRKQRGKTQQDVADYLRLSRTTITRWELGEREPDFDTLKRLAKYFDTTVGFIIGETDDPKPKDAPPYDEVTLEVAALLERHGIKNSDGTRNEELFSLLSDTLALAEKAKKQSQGIARSE